MTVSETLSVLRPSAADTALLEACLHTGQRADDAWNRWLAFRRASGAALHDALASRRRLLPLLGDSVMRNAIEIEADVRAVLMAATLREQLRADGLRRIAAGALRSIEAAGTCVLVTRGVALAGTAYPSWELRHCHDVDLLVSERGLGPACAALRRAGWQTSASDRPGTGSMARHASGLQLALHTRPFNVTFYDVAVDRFAGEAQLLPMDGHEAAAPSREALLVHVLGHATCCSSARTHQWVADAWHVTTGHPALNWDQVVSRLNACRIVLPVSVLLRFLAGIGAPVPAEVLTEVERLAARASPAARDVAVGAALAARSGDFAILWRSARSGRSRVRLGRWMVAPSIGYVRSTFPTVPVWLLPFCYVYRPLRFLRARLIAGGLPS